MTGEIFFHWIISRSTIVVIGINLDQDGLLTEQSGTNMDTHLTIRNTKTEDIPNIIRLQKESFPYLAKYGNIWHTEELESHIRIFPQGQFVAAEPDGTVVGSASTLIVSLKPEYAEHTWCNITTNGLFSNHDPEGDSLYGADISTHPRYRHEGIGTMLYGARKQLALKLALRRMIAGGRLYNYCEQASMMSALQYANEVVAGKLHDPVLSFDKQQIKFDLKVYTHW